MINIRDLWTKTPVKSREIEIDAPILELCEEQLEMVKGGSCTDLSCPDTAFCEDVITLV
jgi:DNA-binding ferritin-like protein (Dps family)